MKSWEELEKTWAKWTGGKRVPGSGNGRLKGDIRSVDSEGITWAFDAKDCQQKQLKLSINWFEELERDCGKSCDLGLVIRYGGEFALYVFEPIFGCMSDVWRVRTFHSVQDLPQEVHTKGGKWVRTDIDEFLSLFS